MNLRTIWFDTVYSKSSFIIVEKNNLKNFPEMPYSTGQKTVADIFNNLTGNHLQLTRNTRKYNVCRPHDDISLYRANKKGSVHCLVLYMAISIFPVAATILHLSDFERCLHYCKKFNSQKFDIFLCCPNKQSQFLVLICRFVQAN